jgi:ABC-type multidrug transport system ATPase subunit
VSSERVRIDRARVRFGRHVILREVSLTLAAGEVVCVRGANGAGKTTMLRLIAGVLRPDAGSRSGPARCAYVPATLAPPSLSARRWLDGVRRGRRTDPGGLLAQLGFDGDLSRGCRELSFGNLRKVLLADALSSDAELVVIDEAAVGLDAVGRDALTELLAARRAAGDVIVTALQQQETIPGVDRELVVRDAVVAETTAEDATVDVQLRGPSTQRAALLDAAQRLGFVAVPPPE